MARWHMMIGALLPKSELTFTLSCLKVAAPSVISRAWLA